MKWASHLGHSLLHKTKEEKAHCKIVSTMIPELLKHWYKELAKPSTPPAQQSTSYKLWSRTSIQTVSIFFKSGKTGLPSIIK